MVKSINDKYLTDGKRVLLSDVMPCDEASVSVLDERARSLSVLKEHDKGSEEGGVKYVRFKIGDNELYGIPYQTILDVKEVDHITQIPLAPPFVVGVCYWHGKIISVIDLGEYFGLSKPATLNKRKLIATISFDQYVIGVSFSDVIGVESFYQDKLDRSIATNKRIKANYILGIHDGKTAILDIKNVLKDIVAELTKGKGE